MKPMSAFLLVGLSECMAQAEPYRVAYNANDSLFPENVAWTRYASEPPAQRWLEGGKLVIDSRAGCRHTSLP